MPRKRGDITCKDCAAPMWSGKGSLPQGEATCRSCRKSQLDHGTRLAYRERRCRCDLCRSWNADAQRRYTDVVRVRDGLSPTQKYRPPTTGNRRRPAPCSRCGGEVMASSEEPMCSECRGANPGRNIAISRSGRVAIYERDGWMCQICLEPVDPDVHPNTTWGATLDHTEPRSKGGTDEPDNLRLAHRWCNSVRNDLSHYDDQDLRIA